MSVACSYLAKSSTRFLIAVLYLAGNAGVGSLSCVVTVSPTKPSICPRSRICAFVFMFLTCILRY